MPPTLTASSQEAHKPCLRKQRRIPPRLRSTNQALKLKETFRFRIKQIGNVQLPNPNWLIDSRSDPFRHRSFEKGRCDKEAQHVPTGTFRNQGV
jgi:hypothetical protein